MSCGAKPSVQISGTRGQGLGSHLCGRISVTRCPIPDQYTTVRRLVPERGPMRRIRFIGDGSQPEVPSGEWWSDRKRASFTARLHKSCLRSPGLALKRLNVATTKGAPWGKTGVGLVYDGVGSLASTQVGNFFGVPTVLRSVRQAFNTTAKGNPGGRDRGCVCWISAGPRAGCRSCTLCHYYNLR